MPRGPISHFIASRCDISLPPRATVWQNLVSKTEGGAWHRLHQAFVIMEVSS